MTTTATTTTTNEPILSTSSSLAAVQNVVSDCFNENICLNDGRCILIGSFFSCICLAEFTGLICEIPLQASPVGCLPDPCNSHGNCIPFLNGSFYLCICQLGYYGTFCELTPSTNPPPLPYITSSTTTKLPEESFTNTCTPNPCQFYGTCVPFINGTFYLCICQIGYTGIFCEEQYGTTTSSTTTTSSMLPAFSPNECTPNPCFNDGICTISLAGKFSGCLCRSSDFSGYYCQNYNICKRENTKEIKLILLFNTLGLLSNKL